MRVHILVSALVLLSGLRAVAQDDAAALESRRREFDFWIGEWHVANRNLRGGVWHETGTARARIRPILGGLAILEEWDGQTGHHRNTFGISVRAYDPETRRWVIVLNWPGPDPARFGRMEGSFRHGRAEFFPPETVGEPFPRATRFTFSDALGETCRWDAAQPVGEDAWRTTWIMEFTRRRSAAETIGDGEPIRYPPPEPACSAPEARRFDRLLGEWRGAGRVLDPATGDSVSAEASFRATSTNRGCATVCFLDIEPDGRPTARSFEVWAWSAEGERWVARAMDDGSPRFTERQGAFDEGGAFTGTGPAGAPPREMRRVRYAEIGPDRFRCVHEVSTDGGESWRTAADLAFARI